MKRPRIQKPKDPARCALVFDETDLAHVKKCARAMLLEPDRMHPPSKPAVVRWALAKCAAEVREG